MKLLFEDKIVNAKKKKSRKWDVTILKVGVLLSHPKIYL